MELKVIRKAIATAATAATIAMMPSAAFAGSVEYDQKIGAAKSSMMKNTAAALTYARDAVQLVEGTGLEANKDRLTAKWLEAEALMRLNRADEARAIAGDALKEAQRQVPGSKLHADLLRSNGSMAARTGMYETALAHFNEARALFNTLGEKRSEAIVLQNIGSIYSDARDYEQVLAYYDKSAAVFSGDKALALSGHNNKGNAYKELGRFDEAEAEFRGALVVADEFGSPMLRARILTNLASTKQLKGQFVEAEATAQEALAIAQEHAPDWSPFVYGVLAQIELARDDLDQAEKYITITFANQSLEQTNALFRDFHQCAAEIFSRRKKEELSAQHDAALRRIEDGAAAIRG